MMADVQRRIMDTKISTYIGEFIATKQTEGLSAKTIAWYRWLLGKFVAGVGDIGLGELTITQARQFIARLQNRTTRYEDHPKARVKSGGLSPYTIAAYVRTLKVFSKWLLEEGHTKSDLFARLKIPKTPDTIIDVLSDDEIHRLIDCINPSTLIGARLYAIILLLLDTGIRASELCALTLGHTDLTDNAIKVMGKGKKERFWKVKSQKVVDPVFSHRPGVVLSYLGWNKTTDAMVAG